MRQPWRLIGREDELNLLSQMLASASSAGVVLSGRAGVGKTRLALELLEHARGLGRPVEWLVATPGTQQISLGALTPVLGMPPPPASQGEVMRWASQGLTQREGLIICVDDAHLLDPMSASVLLQLASRRKAFVIVTARSGTEGPVSLTSLWKDGWVERLEIGPLGRTETGALAGELLGVELDDESVTRLYELSAGVPLFLREVLLAAEEAGSIVDTAEGSKRWRGPVVPTTRLRELVAARLQHLSHPHREAMDLMALGEPLDFPIAERLIEHHIIADLEAWEMLATHRRTGDASGPTLRVTHPLYSEVLRRGLSAARSKDLHRELTNAAMEVRRHTNPEAGRHDDMVVRIASWRLEAADLNDPELLIAAAEIALRTFDIDLAAKLARAGQSAGAGLRADLVLADTLYFSNRWSEAAAALDTLAEADLDDITRAHSAIRRSSLLIWSSGDPETAHDVLTDAASKLSDDDLRSEVDAERAWTLIACNRLDEALTLASTYIDGDTSGERAALRALPPAVVAHALSGATELALEVAERAMSLADSLDDVVPTIHGDIMAGASFALLLAGRLDETMALLDTMLDGEDSDWSDSARGMVDFIRGKATLEQGHAADAVGITRDAIHALRSHGIGLFLQWAHNVLARGLALTGDVDAARTALREGALHHPFPVGLSEPDRLFAEAAIAEATSPGDGVTASAEQACTFEAWGALPYALMSLADKARFGGAETGDADRAERLASRCQGRLAPTLADLVRGLVTGDPELLMRTAAECGSMLLDLHASEAALVAAAAFDEVGQRGSALAARRDANNWLELCGPVRTPILTTYGGYE